MSYFSHNLKCLNTTLAKPLPLLQPHFAAWLPSDFCSQAIVLIRRNVQTLIFSQLILTGICTILCFNATVWLCKSIFIIRDSEIAT